MFKFLAIFALFFASQSASAADESIVGTYRLISSQRLIVETGEREDSYGKSPTGFITYGRDGRMMGIIVFSDRSKPESLDKLTDQQRAELFKTMLAYAGTYKFSGTQVEHHIDASWNEIWTGTTQIRDIRKDGERLVFTTKPAPFPRRQDEYQHAGLGTGQIEPTFQPSLRCHQLALNGHHGPSSACLLSGVKPTSSVPRSRLTQRLSGDRKN